MQRYECIKVLFFHSSLPSIVMCVMILCYSNVLHMTVDVLCFRGYYTSVCLLISLKLFAFVRGMHWCSHQYD
jgi:hypothetical protein